MDYPEVTQDRMYQIDVLLSELGIDHPSCQDSYALYDRALTHSSFTYEHKLSSLNNYERLEFLGDAVLKIIVSEYLFERFPDYREGDLTKIRAVIVSDATLAVFAKGLNLGAYMTFGYSEERSGGQDKSSNLACGFEALLGALFLDGKMNNARLLLVDLLEDEVTRVDLNPTKGNYKAVLQEFTQAEGDGLPQYRTAQETGPAHRRSFHIDVLINQEIVGHGRGLSKKEAQQQAAKMALEALGALPDESSEIDYPEGSDPDDAFS